MSENRPNEREMEIVRLLDISKKIAPDVYLSGLATIGACVGDSMVQFVSGYSRGDYKRAIKQLRIVQRVMSENADFYEQGILHIRKYWLKRDEITPPQVLVSYILPGIWQALSPAHIRKDGKI